VTASCHAARVSCSPSPSDLPGSGPARSVPSTSHRVEAAGLGDIRILDDRDYLAAVGEDLLPEDVRGLFRRLGIGIAAVEGKVRSVTFRAVKR